MSGRRPSDVLSPTERWQRSVLDLLLDAHPAQLSVEEIVRALVEDPDDFASTDDVHNALRELVAVGLVHRHGRFAFASRVAMRSWLLDP